ncbi:MAG: GTPase HflX [Oscillospiraceae bacterium]|nr:GTPase HflX [Oscillospiraceae bacterium]
MYENEDTISRAVLVTVDTGEFDAEVSIKELRELARTAGAETAAMVIQKRPSPDRATYIGSGRLEQLKGEAEMLGADLLIFDCELTADQTRNIENITDIRVIDRTTLILDIFAMRAASAEGRIQVELAQQKYRLAHLAGKGIQLSRLGGGIGTRGPGETKLETDRRHIRSRIEQLKDELEQIRRHRDLIRKRRQKDSVQTCAIVGYTNAGKSTLLNALTGAGVLSEDKLFATLDVTTRALSLPDGREVLLSDTVGLIRRLPHELVDAFRSTLEEAANADIIVNVIDISSDTAEEEQRVTDVLLAELGCADIPRILVLNKCDKLPGAENIPEDDTTVRICAKTGEGFDRLLAAVAKALPGGHRRMTLTIPYDKMGLINAIIEDGGKVFSTDHTAEGAVIDCLISDKILGRIGQG